MDSSLVFRFSRTCTADERDRCVAPAIGATSNSIEAPRNPPGPHPVQATPECEGTKTLIGNNKICKNETFFFFFICKIFTVLIFLSLFTLWLQNLHSVINSGLCLLSTYIRRWNPPFYADPTFRSRSRCTCPADEKKRNGISWSARRLCENDIAEAKALSRLYGGWRRVLWVTSKASVFVFRRRSLFLRPSTSLMNVQSD